MIELIVGFEEETYLAHEHVLTVSFLFEHLCREHPASLKLAEDDAETFGYMLEYLYKSRIPSYSAETHQHIQSFHQKIVLLYVMAEKYGLDRLQARLIVVLKARVAMTCEDFFEDARFMFQNIPREEGPYFVYFYKVAKIHLPEALEEQWMRVYMERGGPFMIALGKVMSSLLKK